MDIWREVGETAMGIVNFLKMAGDIPYKADYSSTKKIVSKLLETDLRLTWEDLVLCFVSLGTDWNLLSKRILEQIINKLRSRASIWTASVSDIS